DHRGDPGEQRLSRLFEGDLEHDPDREVRLGHAQGHAEDQRRAAGDHDPRGGDSTAGIRRQLAAEPCERLAHCPLRTIATAEAPTRKMSAGSGWSILIRTGKRCAMCTHWSSRRIRGTPGPIGWSSEFTAQPTPCTTPAKRRLGWLSTYTSAF